MESGRRGDRPPKSRYPAPGFPVYPGQKAFLYVRERLIYRSGPSKIPSMSRRSVFLSFRLVFCLFPMASAAPCLSAPDCSGYDTQFALANGTNGTVSAMVVKGTDIFVAGTFTAAGNVNANNVARFDTLTNTWSTLGNTGGNGVNSAVETMAVIGNDLYVGGNFSSANVGGTTVSTNSVAKVNLTTGVWSALGGGTFFVHSMAANGTDLYIGGGFTSANGGALAANFIVKYDTMSGVWSTLGTGGGNGVNSSVFSLAVIGGDLYAGGFFTSANTGGAVVSTNHVAKFNMTTGVWSGMGTSGGNGVDSTVFSLATSGTSLYVGSGSITANTGGGGAQVDASRIAKYDTTTGLWSALGTGFSPFSPGVNDFVQSIAVIGSDVYVGGKFTSGKNNFATYSANYLAKFNTQTATWSALGIGGGNGVDNVVYTLAAVGSDLYAGGDLVTSNVGGTTVNASRVVKFSTTSSVWSALGSGGGNGVNGRIFAVATNGTDVYVGGDFTTAGNVIANRVAKFDKLTSTWSSLGTGGGNGVNNTVTSLLIIGGDLYLGGAFTATNVGGTTVAANRIAKFNPTSGAWSAIGSGGGNGVNNTVRALAASGGDLYVGGDFTNANSGADVAANRVAKANTTTGVWSSLGTGAGNGVDNSVYALAVSGNSLFAGGDFLNANSGANVSANRVAKFDTTSSTWSGLGTGAGNGVTRIGGANVRALAVSGSDLFVGGFFDTANAGGVTLNANQVAKVDTVTGVWSRLGLCCGGGLTGPGQSTATQVFSLLVNGNDLYVGGNFTLADFPTNISTNRVAKYSITGNEWSAINDSNGSNGTTGGSVGSPIVYALAVSGPDLFLGGAFVTAGDNVPSAGIAHVCNSAPIIAAGGPLVRLQGAAATNSTIATLSDSITSGSNLAFSVPNSPAGITVTNIVNTNGIVTANVSASCAAGPGDYTVALQASDGSLSASANLLITVTTAEINIKGNGVSIADGSTTPSASNFTDVGLVAVTSSTLARTYTIENSGTGGMNISGITLTGTNSSDFTISGITFPGTVSPGGSKTFTITFDPSSSGVRTATINLASDDCDENPYDFAIQGTGVVADYNVITSGGALVVTDLTNSSGNLDFSEPAAGQIRLTGGGSSVFLVDNSNAITGNGGNLPLSGVTSITMNGGSGNTVINVGAFTTALPNLTINGGAGNDTVNLNGSITFTANANLDLNLQNDTGTPGTDSINIAAAAQLITSGTGTIDVNVSKNVSIGSGGRLQTENGNLAVRANQQSPATTGDFAGVALNGGSFKTTGTGTITVLGKGGNAANNQFGVAVKSGGAIASIGGGAITITGTGGQGSGTRNIGVRIDSGGSVTATGIAGITIAGTGGTGSSDDYGVSIDGLNTSGTTISSVNGNISITGASGSGNGGDQDGVRFENSTGTQATAVNITGSGVLTMTGTAGNFFSSSSGINFVDDTSMTLNGATTTFIADTMDIGASNVSINAGANAVTLKVRTANHAVLLGSADSSNFLGLTDAELDRFTCATLNIGDTVNAASMVINSSITRSTATDINLFIYPGTGQGIVFIGASIDSAGGNVRLNALPFGFTPGTGADVSMGTTGTLSFAAGSRFNEAITGTTVDTGYKQLTVAGNVDLTGVPLNVSGTMTITNAVTFTIVSNDGTDPIVGTFTGLPEGSIINNFLNSGKTAIISYVGGDGNDVTITSPSSAPTISGVTLTRQQGAAPINSTIATVADPSVPAGNLVVTATSVPTGFTIANIVNTNGTVTADVGATCLAERTNFITLQVSNGSLTNNTPLFVVINAPEANVKGNGVSISDGASSPSASNGTDFGTGSGTHTFTIENTGTLPLNLTAISMTGAAASDFIVGSINLPASVDAGSSKTFTVNFTAAAEGPRTATVNISNNDCDEGLYDFAVQGAGAAPAYSVTTTGGALVVTDLLGNGDYLEISEPSPGFINISSPGVVFSVNGTPVSDGSGDLSLTDITSVTINAGAGDDTIQVDAFSGSLPNLTVNGDSGTDTIYFAGPLTFALNASLKADANNNGDIGSYEYIGVYDAISVSGVGTIDLRSPCVVDVYGVVQSENGKLTVEANQQIAPTNNNFSGVNVLGAIQSTGSGDISIKGRGGNIFGNNHGVAVYGTVHGGTSGTVSVMGEGGADPSDDYNIGVWIPGGAITSEGADIEVTGTGASNDGTGNTGVNLNSTGQIVAGGSGSVTVTGNGGASSSNTGSSHGVSVDGADTKIGSSGGDVKVTGNSNALYASGFNFAVAVMNDARISASGAGSLTITEDAGVAQNDGISLQWGGSIGAEGGLLTIDVSATARRGFSNQTTSTVSNPNGDILVIANKQDLQGPIDGGTNTVTLRQKSDGVAFLLGGNSTSAGISLNPTYINNITCGTLNVGDSKSGAITVTAAVTRAASTHINLTSGSDINFNFGLNSAGGNVTVTPGAGHKVTAATQQTDVNMGPTGRLTFGNNPTLSLVINGTFDNQYDQLKVVGEIDLTGAGLEFQGTPALPGSPIFVIVNNDGTDPITGTFTGLPEGATIPNFLNTGRRATITYRGGDGNDVAVTVAPPNAPPVAGPDGINRMNNTRVAKVLKSVLLANDSDPEGDPLSITAVGNATPAGATVAFVGPSVVYTAPAVNSGAGSFTYTLSDGPGGHAVTGTVTVTQVSVPAPTNGDPNITSRIVSGSDTILTFLGVPGNSYRVQYTTNGSPPYSWNEFSPLAVCIAPANGVLRYTDVNPPPPARLYRAVTHP
jgi:hypothetical protein